MTEPASKKIQLYDLNQTQLNEFIKELGEPAYRAKQVEQWLYKELVTDFSEMRNLPQGLRDRLAERATLATLTPLAELVSKDGTRKALLALPDGQQIETVLMFYRHGATVCVSTQVGCGMACEFCATGTMGLLRNMPPGEIIAQVVHFQRLLKPLGQEVTNVVFMGMGEPLANYRNLITAIETLHDETRLGLGARRLTVSTSGLVPRIRDFAQQPLPVNLAISLHAADDELRDRLMPVNHRWPIAELMEACRFYISRTNRRITFEYALMDGVNDSLVQARELAHLLKGMLCHVNLIPINEVPGIPFAPSPRERVREFTEELLRLHIPATVRLERGDDIAAACGQLRVQHGQKQQLIMPVQIGSTS